MRVPLLLLVLCLPAAAHEVDAEPGIAVASAATVSLPPDEAVVRAGAEIRAPTAAEAQERLVERIADAIDSIADAGVARDAIGTASVALHPERRADGARGDGFVASQILTIRVARIERLGAVIDAAIAAGVNRIDEVRFGLRDEEAARRLALRRATTQAHADAQAIAEALDLRLDGLIAAQQADGTPPIARFEAARAAGAAVPAGAVGVTARVTLRYRFAPRQ